MEDQSSTEVRFKNVKAISTTYLVFKEFLEWN